MLNRRLFDGDERVAMIAEKAISLTHTEVGHEKSGTASEKVE